MMVGMVGMVVFMTEELSIVDNSLLLREVIGLFLREAELL
jgi:hypothetical protein